jgi:hypothetical protein
MLLRETSKNRVSLRFASQKNAVVKTRYVVCKNQKAKNPQAEEEEEEQDSMQNKNNRNFRKQTNRNQI